MDQIPFLRLRVSMRLSPFLQTFSEDILCAEPYIFLSLPTTQRFLHLWLHLSHSPCLCLYSLCVSSSPLSFSSSLCLCLSLSFSDCVYLFQVSFYFNHSLSISTPSCPPQVCLSLQAWSLARHKSPSLQPYGSHYHSLSKVCWPLRGPLTLHYASFSISFSLCLCRPLSRTYSLFGCMSLLLSLCLSPSVLPALSVSLLLLYLQVTAHLSLSLPFSLLSPPSSPHSLSLSLSMGAQPTYRNRSWPAVSQICSFTVFPPTLTTRDPNSTPIVWLESCLTGVGKRKEAVEGLRGFPVLQGLLSLYKPILTVEATEAQGGLSKEHTPKQGPGSQHWNCTYGQPCPCLPQPLPMLCPCPLFSALRTTPRYSHLFSMN